MPGERIMVGPEMGTQMGGKTSARPRIRIRIGSSSNSRGAFQKCGHQHQELKTNQIHETGSGNKSLLMSSGIPGHDKMIRPSDRHSLATSPNDSRGMQGIAAMESNKMHAFNDNNNSNDNTVIRINRNPKQANLLILLFLIGLILASLLDHYDWTSTSDLLANAGRHDDRPSGRLFQVTRTEARPRGSNYLNRREARLLYRSLRPSQIIVIDDHRHSARRDCDHNHQQQQNDNKTSQPINSLDSQIGHNQEQSVSGSSIFRTIQSNALLPHATMQLIAPARLFANQLATLGSHVRVPSLSTATTSSSSSSAAAASALLPVASKPQATDSSLYAQPEASNQQQLATQTGPMGGSRPVSLLQQPIPFVPIVQYVVQPRQQLLPAYRVQVAAAQQHGQQMAIPKSENQNDQSQLQLAMSTEPTMAATRQQQQQHQLVTGIGANPKSLPIDSGQFSFLFPQDQQISLANAGLTDPFGYSNALSATSSHELGSPGNQHLSALSNSPLMLNDEDYGGLRSQTGSSSYNQQWDRVMDENYPNRKETGQHPRMQLINEKRASRQSESSSAGLELSSSDEDEPLVGGYREPPSGEARHNSQQYNHRAARPRMQPFDEPFIENRSIRQLKSFNFGPDSSRFMDQDSPSDSSELARTLRSPKRGKHHHLRRSSGVKPRKRLESDPMSVRLSGPKRHEPQDSIEPIDLLKHQSKTRYPSGNSNNNVNSEPGDIDNEYKGSQYWNRYKDQFEILK